ARAQRVLRAGASSSAVALGAAVALLAGGPPAAALPLLRVAHLALEPRDPIARVADLVEIAGELLRAGLRVPLRAAGVGGAHLARDAIERVGDLPPALGASSPRLPVAPLLHGR